MRAAPVALLLAAGVAHAEEPDVTGAPLPGDESGIIEGGDDGDGVLREVGRGMLVLPRAAFEIAFGPVRAGVWAYDRFRLRDRWFQIFFNDKRTIGVYPIVRFDSGFGISGGGRFVARDLFGEREKLAVRAATGGRYRTLATAALRSGDRWRPLGFELGAEYEQRPHDNYYGIGNIDAPEMEYRQELRRASLVGDMRIVRDLHVRAAGALTDLAFASDDAPMLTGDLRHAYGDLELVWDSRGSATKWEPGALASVGWLASIYGGRAAVESGPDFWRYGVDAQHFLRITSGPRVIATRVHAEAVSGRVDEVPFDELPKLGGNTLLRGYPTDRFRDRVAALGTIEYRWDLSRFLVANVFVDAGRVAPSFREIATDSMRVGYGIGLEGYTETQFVFRASIATSRDGGMFFNLAFDPAFDLDPRVDRR